jgi:DNA-binding transcriptional regulator GbsR (MarR family)
MARKRIVCKKLKGLMGEHDITISELSKRIGLSKNSLTMKINGWRDWRYCELLFVIKQFGFSEVKDVFPELYDYILRAG